MVRYAGLYLVEVCSANEFVLTSAKCTLTNSPKSEKWSLKLFCTTENPHYMQLNYIGVEKRETSSVSREKISSRIVAFSLV